MLFTGRVHPGESNSSIILKGVLDFLVSDRASSLRDQIIFKVV